MKTSPVKLTNRKKSEQGQALILIVFAIIGLIGMSAVAIDGGNAYVDNRRADTAASAAALTAAMTRIDGGNWRAAALATAKANGYDNNGITNTVELNTPPIGGPFSGNPEYIEVIITSHLTTYFGPVIGVPQITNVVQAISQSKPAVIGEMFDGYALVSLAPHSRCDKQLSFWIHSEATINLEGGGLFVNSDNPDCAFISYGSGSVRIQDTSPITVVGGAQIQKPKLITPYPIQTGAPPIPYPPAFQLPKVGCGTKMAEVDELGKTMSSGNWDEDIFPPEGVVFLESGVYCIGGDFILDGAQSLEGSSVTIVVDGNIKIGGLVEINLNAPTHGQNQGLLLYMPLGNKGIMTLNGNLNSSYRGTILAPSADVRINGLDSTKGAAYHSQIIGYYIEVDGVSNIKIKYKDEENYDAIKMPEVTLVK
ncbi:MAG: pilus assembly protein TadG-related protein [Anaerolineales bacterium]|nr:MAG: pilus assembly protein TadG-related protein [Anaerolineales bacterium]